MVIILYENKLYKMISIRVINCENTYPIIKGKGKQMYLSKLATSHAEYILKELLKLPQDAETKEFIEETLKSL